MHRPVAVMFGSLIVIALLLVALVGLDTPARSRRAGSSGPLMLYCAASNESVIEKVRKDYEEEFGRPVQIQFGPSQTLLSSLEVSGTGDLYLPADDSYLDMGREKGLIAEVLPIAAMRGVIAVKAGNPLGIETFEDLLREDVRVVQANPDAAAIGKVTRRVLSKQGRWDALDDATVAYRSTVTDVANDILVNAADAGIVYDAVLHTYPDLEPVPIPELADTQSDIALGVLNSSADPAAALHFARYVSARDRGQKHYRAHGFRTHEGDTWSDVPELTLFAGSMLQPAIEETIEAFEQREGVRVTRVYNGCGILVAQMKGGQHPDAYFACDREFMNHVPDLFPESVDVSENELVILVQKGNPHDIRSLKDLGREGLRVGIGHEKQCAMGWITQNTLREGGVQQEVMSNVTVESATGDTLVNQMQTGSLDAAVAYLSNAAGAGDSLEAIAIEGIPCSIAVQPFAIRPDSPNRMTLERLFEAIQSAESREIFEAEGFRWELSSQRRSADVAQ